MLVVEERCRKPDTLGLVRLDSSALSRRVLFALLLMHFGGSAHVVPLPKPWENVARTMCVLLCSLGVESSGERGLSAGFAAMKRPDGCLPKEDLA